MTKLTLSSLSLNTANNQSSIDYDQTHIPWIPSHYIQVIEEPMGYHDSKELPKKTVDSVSSCGSFSSEAYEKTTTKHGDKMFYKFHKRLSRCPEQILRCVSVAKWYRFNLLASTGLVANRNIHSITG